MDAVSVTNLWRHPIKGHGVEALGAVELETGRALPYDRRWAIAHTDARVVPGIPTWAHCMNFSRGARSPSLMAIRAEVDEAAGTVTLSHPDQEPITVDPDDPEDAARLVAWATPLSDPRRSLPAFVVSAEVAMTDTSFPSVSILNVASLGDLAAKVGAPIAQERFRGNVWLEGLPPWVEFDLIGKTFAIGEARLTIRERIERCRATTVNPATGVPDLDTLRLLKETQGHQDFGIYAEVTTGGRIAVGDPVEILP